MPRRSRLPIGERVKSFLLRHGGNAELALTDALTTNDRLKARLEERAGAGGASNEDAQLRADNERLEEEVSRISALIPPQGSVVLSADDAKKWETLKGLGKTPDEISASLKKVTDLESQIAQRDRAASIATAAGLAGYKPSVLTDLANRAGNELHIELRDVTEKVDGKDVQKKVPHVRKRADEKATLEPLSAYIEREAKDYLPALKAEENGGGGSTGTAKVTPFPAQSAKGDGAPSGDMVADHIKKTNEARGARANPLFGGQKSAAAK